MGRFRGRASSVPQCARPAVRGARLGEVHAGARAVRSPRPRRAGHRRGEERLAVPGTSASRRPAQRRTASCSRSPRTCSRRDTRWSSTPRAGTRRCWRPARRSPRPQGCRTGSSSCGSTTPPPCSPAWIARVPRPSQVASSSDPVPGTAWEHGTADRDDAGLAGAAGAARGRVRAAGRGPALLDELLREALTGLDRSRPTVTSLHTMVAWSVSRLRDPLFWGDVVQLGKTVLAAVLAWVVAAELLDLSQPFLAPWAALLVVHATVYRTFSRGLQQVAAAVVAVVAGVGDRPRVGPEHLGGGRAHGGVPGGRQRAVVPRRDHHRGHDRPRGADDRLQRRRDAPDPSPRHGHRRGGGAAGQRGRCGRRCGRAPPIAAMDRLDDGIGELLVDMARTLREGPTDTETVTEWMNRVARSRP